LRQAKSAKKHIVNKAKQSAPELKSREQVTQLSYQERNPREKRVPLFEYGEDRQVGYEWFRQIFDTAQRQVFTEGRWRCPDGSSYFGGEVYVATFGQAK
jgi:hypothetical protein